MTKVDEEIRKMRKLLLEIAKCNNFISLVCNSSFQENNCKKIVDFQRGKPKNCDLVFQLPEPWSGDILNAPILFISSNPSYSEDELFPSLLKPDFVYWPDDFIVDFFVGRFENRGEKYSWVYENKCLKKDGGRGRAVRYWTWAKNITKELLGREPLPGIDYCITELVHCKSQKQEGVIKALPECTEKFFERIIEISGAKLIVAVGEIVRKFLKENYEKNSCIKGIPVIYLPHPNAWKLGNFKGKTIGKNYPEKLEYFREILREETERKINIQSLLLEKERVESFIKKLKNCGK